MIYLPILGAIALAGGTIWQGGILRRKGITTKQYFVFEFLALTILAGLLMPFLWQFNSDALLIKNILIFVGVIIISIIANTFVFYSMKWEKINNLEPAKVLEPLFVILLAIVFSFFAQGFERNFKIIIPAIVAVLALIFSHVEKRHLTFNRYFLAAIAGSFFFGLELVLSRLILDLYNPIMFYFLRCAGILLFSLIIFHPKTKNLNKKIKLEIFAVGIFWVFYRGITYWGYQKLGVIFTTLVMLLGPVFVYTFARIFLKEKLRWKNIIASIVIVLAVAYALIF